MIRLKRPPRMPTVPFFSLGALLLLAVATLSPRAAGSLTTALDRPEWSWTTGGDRPWTEVAEAGALAGGSVAQWRAIYPAEQWLGCVEGWLETTVEGPGVFGIWVRQNRNPYVHVSLSVDGETFTDAYAYGYEPDTGFDSWTRFTAPLPAGAHAVRLTYSFYCEIQGTLAIENPTVQVDDAQLLPEQGAALIDAAELPSTLWRIGGPTDAAVVTEGAHDGVDALVALPTPPAGPGTYGEFDPPWWIAGPVEGPATVAWWEQVGGGEWQRQRRFLLPQERTFRWEWSQPFLIDEFSVTPEQEVPLAEALEAPEREFTATGGWKGFTTAAASDGVDQAVCTAADGETGTLSTRVTGPALVAWAARRYEVTFTIDGRRPVFLDATNTNYVVPPGTHELAWTSPSGGTLDGLSITPTVAAPLGAVPGAGFVWRTSGQKPWSAVGSNAMAPAVEADAESWLETDVTGPAVLRCVTDGTRVSVDGEPVPPARWSTYTQGQTLMIPPGVHTVRWESAAGYAWVRAVTRHALAGQVEVTFTPPSTVIVTVPLPEGFDPNRVTIASTYNPNLYEYRLPVANGRVPFRLAVSPGTPALVLRGVYWP